MQRTPRFLLSALALSMAMAANASSTAPAPESPVVNSELNGEMFYQLLVGEMSARSGDVSTAFVLMLDAARKSKSEPLYERTVELALRAGSGESAMQATQQWLRAYPLSAQANRYQLQILIGLNRITETIDPIKKELASLSNKDRALAINMLPRYFAQVPDRKQAAQVVERALDAYLVSPEFGGVAWTTVGRMRLLANDPAGALDAATKGVAVTPRGEEPALLALELLAPQSARGPQAEALINMHLATNNQAGIRLAYVRKLLQLQRYAEALQQSQVLTKQAPASPEAWLIQGTLEFQLNNWTAAKASLNTLVALAPPAANADNAASTDPGVAQALFLLAQIAEREDKPSEAQALLERIVGTQFALRVQTRRAALIARQGRLEEARALIRAVPESSPEDARDKRNAEVQLLRDAKNFKAAYALLQEALTKTPDDVDLIYDQAMLAERLEKFGEMEQLLRRVIAVRPDYHHAYNALGYSMADRNVNLPQARELLTKALSFAPNDPYIQDSMAWLEYRSTNYAEALRLLQAAYQARPDAEIAAHLGEVLWVSGQENRAIAIWDEGKKLSPDNETLLQTIERLRGKP
jgi:tetratricopeptide (TPR) repeat protein